MIDFKRLFWGREKMMKIILATPADAKLLESLAYPIWRQHYTPIIGAQQVEYMLAKFQSSEAIKLQMSQGIDYYIVSQGDKNAGYYSLDYKSGHLFISKFYLGVQFRGQGIAHAMLKEIEKEASKKEISQLKLTVNKYNPAYQAYLKLGFKNTKSIVVDIGQGFIMDDFVMVKKIVLNK